MDRRAEATLRLSDGTERVVRPGDLIGRLWRADLSIDDPAVSEVHALVTLRGGALKIRRLGGPLRVSGMPATEVELRPGLGLSLAPEVVLTVVEVVLPEEFPAMSVNGEAPHPLLSERYSVTEDGRLIQGDKSEGCFLWTNGEDWFVAVGNQIQRKLVPGEPLTAGEHQLCLTTVQRTKASTPATRHQAMYKPLNIIARWDTVHVHQAEDPILTFSGIMARVVSELASLDGPAPWYVVAGEIWPDLVDEREQLRRRWDKTLEKIRGKLRSANVRPDLVRSGAGHVSLALLKEDVVDVRV